MKKRVKISLQPEAIQYLKDTDINTWIQIQAPKYQDLDIPPIPNEKQLYVPTLTTETLDALNKIPGRTNSQKLNTLYWEYQERKRREKNRREIMEILFLKGGKKDE